MGRDLDDLCAAIKHRAAMNSAREKMSDEEWGRSMRTLAEDVRVALLRV